MWCDDAELLIDLAPSPAESGMQLVRPSTLSDGKSDVKKSMILRPKLTKNSI
jgi:hypothetical protein